MHHTPTTPPRPLRAALTTLTLSAAATLTACHPPAAPDPYRRPQPVAHEDVFGNVSYTTTTGGVETLRKPR